MDAKLVVVGGDAKPAEIKLKLPTIVGRGRDASLTLPHPLVSRQHCEIYATGGKLFVRDLGSLNGTFVNSERIEGDQELPSGELLTIGTVTFRAMYAQDGAVDPAHDLPPTGEIDPQAPVVVPSNAATVQADNPPMARPIAEPATEFAETPPPHDTDSADLDAMEVEFDSSDVPVVPNVDGKQKPSTDLDDDAFNQFLSGLD